MSGYYIPRTEWAVAGWSRRQPPPKSTPLFQLVQETPERWALHTTSSATARQEQP